MDKTAADALREASGEASPSIAVAPLQPPDNPGDGLGLGAAAGGAVGGVLGGPLGAAVGSAVGLATEQIGSLAAKATIGKFGQADLSFLGTGGVRAAAGGNEEAFQHLRDMATGIGAIVTSSGKLAGMRQNPGDRM